MYTVRSNCDARILFYVFTFTVPFFFYPTAVFFYSVYGNKPLAMRSMGQSSTSHSSKRRWTSGSAYSFNRWVMFVAHVQQTWAGKSDLKDGRTWKITYFSSSSSVKYVSRKQQTEFGCEEKFGTSSNNWEHCNLSNTYLHSARL
mgnify:CR=1 FL=1